METAAVMQTITRAFEGVGVLIIIGGFFVALFETIACSRKQGTKAAYTTMRGSFGRGVLLGLEILVAADLIRTVTVAPTLDSVIVLGLLVLIRTFLSWSFEIELEGVVPWRRREEEAGAAPGETGRLERE